MGVLLIIIGLLLLLFGGGCTLILVFGGLFSDPGSLTADLPLLFSILVPFGLLPAGIGWLLFRAGQRRVKDKNGSIGNDGTPPDGGVR
jgi:hypothetical protein